MNQHDIEFASLDGYVLRGTLADPSGERQGNVVIVHGITVDRDEFGGFNIRLAERLAAQGFGSLRFDLRGHGKSDGSYEDLTLCSGISDIAAAISHMHGLSGQSVHLVASSFGGGLASLYAARYSDSLASLVLLNPNLDYRRSWLSRDPYWEGDGVSGSGARDLAQQGWVSHGDFRVGRALLHELAHLSPAREMREVTTPTLTVHGSADSIVPYDVAAEYHRVAGECEFIRLEGADHGFVVPGDDDGTSEESKAMQSEVFDQAVRWVMRYESVR